MKSFPTTGAEGQTPGFDIFVFVKYIKNIHRAYRSQSMELISLCRTFSQAQGQTPDPDARLRFLSALKVIDEALSSAVGVTKTSEKVDRAFKRATEELERYEMKYCHKGMMVNERMAAAKAKDNAFQATYNVLLATHNKQPKPTIVVEFFLLKSLPDPEPIIVKQVLSHDSTLREILWNFSRFEGKKRVTLKQNPHFYKFSDIPMTPEQCDGEFKVDLIENFQHAIRDAKIWVITDKPSIFISLRTPQHSWVFGNAWHVPYNNAIIFKHICGKLEGENIAHRSISVPSGHLWYLREPSSPTSPPVVFRDWREPIRRPIRRRLRLPVSECRITLELVPHRLLAADNLLRTTMNTLNDDVLFSIFGSYRLDDNENWNLQLRWCKLTHVCRRWRDLIYGLPSHLDLHLLCTNGTPVADMLNHSPPLPLSLNYPNRYATMTVEDEEGILLALQHHGRVRRIVLHTPSQGLHKFLTAMNANFLTLERLSILSTSGDDARLVMPRSFQAARLSHLTLLGVTLSTEPRTLASTASLVSLTLMNPRTFPYFTPQDLAAQLQFVPLLEELSISFSVPIPHPHIQMHGIDFPITRVTLTALKRFKFRGVSAYLEGLLTRISAPCLEKFDVTLSNELIFTLPVLSRFIDATTELRFPVANVNFNKTSLSISISNRKKEAQGDRSLYVQVSCTPFDWQVSSAAQICNALWWMLPAVEELTIDFYEDAMPPEWQNEVDSSTWCDLLRPFKCMKMLWVGLALTLDLSRALQPDEEQLGTGGGMPEGLLLPVLQELVFEGRDHDAFTAFMDVRQRVGCPIQLVCIPMAPTPMAPTPMTPTPMTKRKKNWFQKYIYEYKK